ncbi:hypothetical protein, partial [Aeromonas caviae]|uniref:hypothetical protein n=1 Tax=Aeromonas caviae TaxID=648 RepID=UPI001CC696C9
EATQELEHTHGLTLTPGLGDARAERRKLTDKEINMAVGMLKLLGRLDGAAGFPLAQPNFPVQPYPACHDVDV